MITGRSGNGCAGCIARYAPVTYPCLSSPVAFVAGGLLNSEEKLEVWQP